MLKRGVDEGARVENRYCRSIASVSPPYRSRVSHPDHQGDIVDEPVLPCP